MSVSNDFAGAKSGAQDKDVQQMQTMMAENIVTYNTRHEDIRTLKDYRMQAFQVISPSGNKWTESLQPIQVLNRVMEKLKRPSVTYHAEGMDKIIADVVRDGVATCKEEGGFNAVLTDKPSMYYEALAYGDGFCRIGINPESKFPIVYDNIQPDSIYVDSNANVMHSKNSTRAVTRMAIIYSYDKDQAKALYPNKKFNLGRIPRPQNADVDFNQSDEQDMLDRQKEVEVAHYFDIGGKEPVYLVIAGASSTILQKFKGKDYPFISKRSGKPFIPVGQFRGPIDSDEGFFNIGLQQIFYKWFRSRQRLFNKQFGNAMRAMTDTKILNTGKMKSGETIKRIRDAKRMAKNGEQALIINDSGEPMVVTPLEASQFEDGLKALQDQLDLEVKRMGINLDSIREAQSTTATQIIAENEVEDAFAQQLINKNTEFFKFIEYATMDLIQAFVDDKDDTPIRTNAKKPAIMKNEAGGDEINPATGMPIMDIKADGQPEEEDVEGVTLGTVKQFIDEEDIWVEVDTRSGVRQKDSLQAARAIAMAQLGAGNPAVANAAVKAFSESIGFELGEEVFQPQGQKPQGNIPQQGIQAAAATAAGDAPLPLA